MCEDFWPAARASPESVWVPHASRLHVTAEGPVVPLQNHPRPTHGLAELAFMGVIDMAGCGFRLSSRGGDDVLAKMHGFGCMSEWSKTFGGRLHSLSPTCAVVQLSPSARRPPRGREKQPTNTFLLLERVELCWEDGRSEVLWWLLQEEAVAQLEHCYAERRFWALPGVADLVTEYYHHSRTYAPPRSAWLELQPAFHRPRPLYDHDLPRLTAVRTRCEFFALRDAFRQRAEARALRVVLRLCSSHPTALGRACSRQGLLDRVVACAWPAPPHLPALPVPREANHNAGTD